MADIKDRREVAVALGTPSDRESERQVTSCDLRTRREHLRAAMSRLGVEVNHVSLDWSCDHSYVVRVLSGDKPWPEGKVALLPMELQIAMVEEACKDFQIVTGTLAALIHLLESLMTVVARERRLPDRTVRQAKAGIVEGEAAHVAAR